MPSCARVVGFWAAPAPEEDAVEAFSDCASSRSTGARIGSPLGWNSVYWTVTLIGAAFQLSCDPQVNLTNGGAPPLRSIILRRSLVTPLTLSSGPSSDVSNSSCILVTRGRPPPNSGFGRSTPLVGL